MLSGMGGDGTAGLACIKEMGGVTIAQLPSDAEHGSMPRPAIASGMADFVLAAAEIPRKLAELRDISGLLRRQAARGHALDGVPLDLGTHPDVALGDVLAVLRESTGHDVAHYRRPSLLRGLERRLQVRGVSDLAGYHQLLCDDAVEVQALRKDLLIGVTGFYRDREAFDALQRLVLPGLMAPGRAPPRAWGGRLFQRRRSLHPGHDAGRCRCGETVDEAAAPAGGRGWQIFASNIDEHAIEVARAGLYPAAIAEAIPAPQLERYFTREAEQ